MSSWHVRTYSLDPRDDCVQKGYRVEVLVVEVVEVD